MLRLIAFSLALLLPTGAFAISVEDYFSVQEQASVENVFQKEARTSLNGLFAGIHDGLFAAVYFGGGVLHYEGSQFICMDDPEQLTREKVRQAITESVGTFERPKLSSAAAAKMPLGMHAMLGLSQMYPCSE